MISPCFNTMGTPEWDIYRVIDFAHTLDFPFVEIRILENCLNLYELDCFTQKDAIQKIKDELEQKLVKIISLNLSYDLMGYHEKTRHEIIQYAKIADALNIKYLRFFAGQGEYTNELTQDEFHKMFNAIDRINNILRDFQTKLLLETHDILINSDDVLKIQERFDHAIPILWDFEHTLLKGQEAWQDSYAKLKDYIAYVHIKDIKMDQEQMIHTFIQEGDLPVREMLKFYQQLDRDIIVSLEWEKLWFPDIPPGEIAIRDFSRRLKKEYVASDKIV